MTRRRILPAVLFATVIGAACFNVYTTDACDVCGRQLVQRPAYYPECKENRP